MKFAIISVVLLVCCIFVNSAVIKSKRDHNPHDKKVVCYVGTWANYKDSDEYKDKRGAFKIEDIPVKLCTHIMYGFAKLDDQTLEITAFDPWLDLPKDVDGGGLNAYHRFNKLKQKNPELTTLLALGGWNEGSIKYSEMASTPSGRTKFVKSVVNLLKEYDFDGLDFDWEFPANREGVPEDKENFIKVLQELKTAFEPHGFVLSAAVSAGKPVIETAYDIKRLNELLDFMSIMGYDYHGGWENVTGHNAPLYKRPDDEINYPDVGEFFYIDYAVNYWIKHGADPQKMVLGLPLYGRSFTLDDKKNHKIGAPAGKPGNKGLWTLEDGVSGYNEICLNFNAQHGWTRKWDCWYKAPYAYKGNQWIGYDDADSFRFKIDYAKKMNLGGGMVWSLETEDFKGLCKGKTFPLTRMVHDAFIRGVNLGLPIEPVCDDFVITTTTTTTTTTPTPPPPPTTTTTTTTPTPPPPSSTTTTTTTTPKVVTPAIGRCIVDEGHIINCNLEGYFPHPSNCKKFVQCEPYGLYYKIWVERCAVGTVWDDRVKACNDYFKVPPCKPLDPGNIVIKPGNDPCAM